MHEDRQREDKQLETVNEQSQVALDEKTYEFWLNDTDEHYERKYRSSI